MSIDWGNLPTLIGPRFKRVQSEKRDRERLAANKHAKRKRPKNHATNRERSYLERTRAARLKAEAETRDQYSNNLRHQIRAYWRGERENYPTGSQL